MKYKVVKTDIIDPDISSSEWDRANVGYISFDRWKEYAPTPITSFKVLRGPEGISVLMSTEEKNLRAECNEENGDIYCDSCMEFFFKPDPLDVNYVNFELNPNGRMYLSVGSGRHGRELLFTDRKIFNIVSNAKDGAWVIKFYIPESFLLEHFDRIAPVCKGNFYKCGDKTDHVHFGSWSEVEVESPDFHVPDFFGRIEMQ